jgi:hypothetical protein
LVEISYLGAEIFFSINPSKATCYSEGRQLLRAYVGESMLSKIYEKELSLCGLFSMLRLWRLYVGAIMRQYAVPAEDESTG